MAFSSTLENNTDQIFLDEYRSVRKVEEYGQSMASRALRSLDVGSRDSTG